ncbi:hypothetical protein ACFUIW_19595 [Streptomyces sp. NPDC057245]|uniref:hypothetical protein n=1 Tax=Streptomyces sp. NPDC057245 TaxID=3346065 RepID=UPI003643DF6C
MQAHGIERRFVSLSVRIGGAEGLDGLDAVAASLPGAPVLHPLDLELLGIGPRPGQLDDFDDLDDEHGGRHGVLVERGDEPDRPPARWSRRVGPRNLAEFLHNRRRARRGTLDAED